MLIGCSKFSMHSETVPLPGVYVMGVLIMADSNAMVAPKIIKGQIRIFVVLLIKGEDKLTQPHWKKYDKEWGIECLYDTALSRNLGTWN